MRSSLKNRDSCTEIGGVDPTTIAAGTIDLMLESDAIKISKMRIDSGHFKPGPDTLELMTRYVKQHLNPKFYDQLVLNTFEGDTKTPEIVIHAPSGGLMQML